MRANQKNNAMLTPLIRQQTKKSQPVRLAFKVLVEAAGIEPASASTLQAVLHT